MIPRETRAASDAERAAERGASAGVDAPLVTAGTLAAARARAAASVLADDLTAGSPGTTATLCAAPDASRATIAAWAAADAIVAAERNRDDPSEVPA